MRIARIVLAALLFAVLTSGPAARANWPWSNTEAAKSPAPNKNKQPSALSKMSTSTKNFFGGLFGAKKPDPKKNVPVRPCSPYAVKKKEPKKESLLTSWFGPKEPPPPKSVQEWMNLEPIRP